MSSSSSNYVFLLFLLFLSPLPVFLLLKALKLTAMSDVLNSGRDGNDSSSRWKALILESETAIERYLPEDDIDLASFIRCITFRAFLVVFLGVDRDTLAFANVQRVTASLSDFYDDRQARSSLPADLQSILYTWLPRKRYPSCLDRILPAYEALWRIIATIVVTCEEDETRALRWVMLDFRDNPRDRQYTASFGSGKSASAITDDVVDRLGLIARLQQAATSHSLLSYIHHAFSNSSAAERVPSVPEALRFAALLASMVVGRVGVHYAIFPEGVRDARASPWDRRTLRGINRTPAPPVNVTAAEMLPGPRASTARQMV